MKIAISRNGKQAVTEFRVNKEVELDDRTLTSVWCFPLTGRTHQLRVHLCALNAHIVGDSLYSGRKQLKWVKEVLKIDRMLLHARQIEIMNNKGTPQKFQSEIPQEFNQFV